MKVPQPPVLVITDRQQARTPLADVLAAAFAAGCRWASVREKDLPREEQVALAKLLMAVAQKWGARLTLHGNAVLAQDAGLDGVHLSAGANAAVARELMGKTALIGISVHSVAEAEKLDPAVLDYAIAGPAYDTPSKPHYGPVLGMIGIAGICKATSIPIIAIGGITSGAVAEMHVAGAVGVAVMGSIMRAEDPFDEVKMLIAAVASQSWSHHPRPR